MNFTLTQIIVACLLLASIALLAWRARKPKVHFANIAEGRRATGNRSYLADAAIATRFFVVKQGSDADHIAASAANTDIPLGVCTDEPTAAEESANVAIFGAAQGTIKVVAQAAITAGALVQSNGDGKIITLKATTGTWYILGRAITAAAADGDVIEIAHYVPVQRVVP
jgi:hypothetical protein